MLKSKSALFISLLMAAQLASAGSVIIEKHSTPPIDQSPNGVVILENQADNGTVILERGIIVQDKLAGTVIIEKAADTQDAGAVILEKTPVLERGGIKLLSGGLIIDRHLAGGLIIDRYGRNA
jgi:hypothetical protein